jgi:hypothetical protein
MKTNPLQNICDNAKSNCMSFASKTTLRRLRFAVYGLLALCFLSVTPAKAQTVVQLMPIPKPQFFYPNGAPLSGGKLFFYETGTSIPLGTFTDYTGTIPNANPMTLDAGGFVNPGVWLIVGDTYRITVQDMNGVQQYVVDGIQGVGGGSLSIFSTPNTFTATQTFTNGIILSGASTFSGTIAGSPSFIGTPGFVTFSISNTSVINNLNAQYWDGTGTAQAPHVLGQVPVITAVGPPDTATWEAITPAILPGSGVTTINGTPCTIGSSCAPAGSNFPQMVYSTAQTPTSSSIGTTLMVTVGASNANYRIGFIASQTALGVGCGANLTTVNTDLVWTDPNAAAPQTLLVAGSVNSITGAGTVGSFIDTFTVPFRAKALSSISFSTTVIPGAGCSPAPQYQLIPILEQVTAN